MRGLLAGRGGLGAVAFLADRGSVVVVLGFSCLSVCGIFPTQGSNPPLRLSGIAETPHNSLFVRELVGKYIPSA